MRNFFEKIRTMWEWIEAFFANFSKKWTQWFLTGLVLAVPFLLTIFIIWKTFNFLDGITGKYLKSLIGFRIPGLGIITTLLLIIMIGAFQEVIGTKTKKNILDKIESWINKLPIIRTIYSTLKQLISMLTNSKGFPVGKVVLVEYPRKGIYSVGIRTTDKIPNEFKNLDIEEDLEAIFIPTTPNPTSGMLIYVSKKQIIEVDMSIEEAFKLVVSFGTLSTTNKI